ncbi:MAG: VOC family protein [Actinomycetota bacterium]
MSLSELFHVGIVVPDLDAGRARFTELLGIEWGPVIDTDIEIRDANGRDRVVPNRMCYSTSPPYLELIQEVAGTPWVCNEHSNLHHIGYYSGALAADSGRLRATACPLEAMDGHGSRTPECFTYHRDPLGVRIELVNAEMREGMEGFLMRAPPDSSVEPR